MNADLAELKSIINGPDWEDEDKKYVAELEEQFHRAVADQKLLTIPSVVDFVKHVESEIYRIKELLSESTLKLSERQLVQLHERKEVLREFLSYFKPQNRVEETIKQHLNVAKGKKDI
jgi:hypothetical protein